jgi:hypothetical protein
MSTQIPTPSAPETRRSASRVIALLTIALGAIVLIVAVWGGVAPTVASAFVSDDERSVDVTGVTELAIDVSATSLTVRFAAVDEATLEVRSASGSWVIERDDDTLRLETPPMRFWWFSGGNGRAVLTLPESLAGLDADISSSAGSVVVDGEFGELDVSLSAGDLTVNGRAQSVSAETSAGSAELDLAGVRDAEFDLSAGDMTARLSGDAPREVEVSVSAGSLDLTLPDVPYAITSDVSAGSFDNGLRTASNATHRLHVELSAGDVRVAAG